MDHLILAYYIITPIAAPELEVKRHKDFFEKRNFRGRIYISGEGINGQASGIEKDAEEYMAWMREDPRFADAKFKIHRASEHPFPKMTVKYRKQLVAMDQTVDFSKRGEAVPPKEWKKMLEEEEKKILLDVRNDYEWKAGHFEGAELPQLEQFRHFPKYAKELREQYGVNTPVMMYCTGGIRCEYYSALLKEEGFEKVYQLDGGVIQYGLEEGSTHWKGKLFVFDDRMVVPLGSKNDVIARCIYCDTLCDVYYNCANMDCNGLFFSCLDCLRSHIGCCKETCQTGRVRPYHEDGKPFRRMHLEECGCVT